MAIPDIARDLESALSQIYELIPNKRRSLQHSDEVKVLRNAIKIRKRREDYFGADLFGEPAWDMLLDLYLSELQGRRVSISSLTIASNVPATTALRWIQKLIDVGLLQKKADPLDARRYWASLTERGTQKMRMFLAENPLVA